MDINKLRCASTKVGKLTLCIKYSQSYLSFINTNLYVKLHIFSDKS